MTAATGSYRDIADRLLAGKSPVHSLSLDFNHCRIDVASNSADLTARLKDYYREFLGSEGEPDFKVAAIETDIQDPGLSYTVKRPEPGKSSLKEEYADFLDGRVVRKIKTGMVFMFGGGDNYAFGPCLENLAQVVNFINNRHIERSLKQGGLLFHAAGVAVNGKGLALTGFSGAGKSTLALHLMGKGTDFVSNDRLVARRNGSAPGMVGVAKMPRVNPGTVMHNESLRSVMDPADRERFSRLSRSELWDLEHKYDAFIDTCFGPGRFKLAADMAGLVVLNWKRGPSPPRHAEVNLSERRDLMPAFMKSPGLFFALDDPAAPPDASEERYLELLGDCPVLEFTGGVDFDEAVDAGLNFLNKYR